MSGAASSRKTEWLVTLPSFAWLLVFFAVPALIVLAFTFHGHTANGGVGDWSLSTWRELVDPDYPTIVWKTMLHPTGWLQTCYHAYLHFKCWLFALLPGAQAPAAAPGAGGDCLIGIAGCAIDAAKTTILDSEIAVVLVSVYSFLPFAIMPIYTAAEKFDFSLLEAARDLGARNFYAFRKIFIPGIRQGIVSAVLMVFIPAIGSYVIPQMLGGTECVLIGNKIFMRAMQNRNIPHASALATLMAVSVFVPLGIAMWWRKRQAARDRRRLEVRTAQLMAAGGMS